MIPILYSSTEAGFITNGLGALSDAATCVVTEERNGSYELEMTYPIKGRHYRDIALDAIIYAQPSDGKEPQPFQIYKISTPINDIITISAQHISYRLSFIPVSPMGTMGASETLNGFKTNSIINHPFTVWTDIENTTSKFSRLYPSSFRECIGGTEGSFLDIFGGEIEWDKFQVKLHSHRGADNGVRIAYSKNLTEYTNEESNEEVITALYPYWTDSETGEITTCGIVYGVKDFGYTPVPQSAIPPEWIANTYYKIKTSGYYQNDEDLVPDWLENTYYQVKKTGYYNIDSASAPTWEANKYYSVLPYGYFNISGETAPEFAYDTYYDNYGMDYVKLSETTAPEWKINTYYENTGTSTDPVYLLTTEKPSDWSSNYNNYYICTDSYFELLTYKPYDWDTNYTKYYIYKDPEYVVTSSRPVNWTTEYKSYFVHYEYDDSNPIYILTVEEPEDWGTNYNDYFVYYEQVVGKTDYILTMSRPSDWTTNYTSYYTYWEEHYSDDYAFSRIVSIDFSSDFQEKPTERLLKRYASYYINSTSLTTKSTSLDVSFVALWQTEEYKNIAPLERVNLCDTVVVDFKEENSISSVRLKVIETEYDVLAERYNSIKLGDAKSSLPNTISNINTTIEDAVAETKSSLQISLENAAKVMSGGLGGNVKINYNGKGRPCEIIVGNSDDISKMTECLRINYKGVGFSRNGYNGPYTSFWDLNGEFDAQCIKVGTIDGGSIKADTIQASSFTSSAKDELLSDVNNAISRLQTGLDGLTDISGWLRVVDGHLYIGDVASTIVIVQGSFEDPISHQVYQKISFVDTSTEPSTELAFIANNRFHAPSMEIENDLTLGGYTVSASKNAEEGISFKWTGGGI